MPRARRWAAQELGLFRRDHVRGGVVGRRRWRWLGLVVIDHRDDVAALRRRRRLYQFRFVWAPRQAEPEQQGAQRRDDEAYGPSACPAIEYQTAPLPDGSHCLRAPGSNRTVW